MKKTLALLGLLVMVVSGCGVDWGSTPALSSKERHAQIWRNWNYEGGQAIDDLDHALMLRPASGLTIWNVHEMY